MTPIESESEFSGQYNPTANSARLQSTLQVVSVLFEVTRILNFESSGSF